MPRSKLRRRKPTPISAGIALPGESTRDPGSTSCSTPRWNAALLPTDRPDSAALQGACCSFGYNWGGAGRVLAQTRTDQNWIIGDSRLSPSEKL